ncbi:MAG: hypothetical protein C5S44_04845 [Candidatus Methanocomedens sp.]|nr:MAG: hypothetical protein C5S44_04845 [ANME-2 cluster archaeon]
MPFAIVPVKLATIVIGAMVIVQPSTELVHDNHEAG